MSQCILLHPITNLITNSKHLYFSKNLLLVTPFLYKLKYFDCKKHKMTPRHKKTEDERRGEEGRGGEGKGKKKRARD